MARIKWHLHAFQEIRRLDKVDEMLQSVVDQVLEEAGEGYEGGVEAGRTRSRGYVVTSNPEGERDNAKNNTLVRALVSAHVGGGSG